MGGTPSHPPVVLDDGDVTTGHPDARRGVQRAAQRPGAAAELPFRRGAAGDDAHGAAVAVAWKKKGGKWSLTSSMNTLSYGSYGQYSWLITIITIKNGASHPMVQDGIYNNHYFWILMDGMTINHVVSIDHGSPGILDFWDFLQNSTTFLEDDSQIDGFRRKNWGDSGILWRIFLPGWERYGWNSYTTHHRWMISLIPPVEAVFHDRMKPTTSSNIYDQLANDDL